MEALGLAAIQRYLGKLNEGLQDNPWVIRDEKLHKEFVFSNFVEAFGFMTQAAIIAESMNHHPEWFNVYSTVKIRLSTHDAGGVTDKDFNLAEKVEAIIQSIS